MSKRQNDDRADDVEWRTFQNAFGWTPTKSKKRISAENKAALAKGIFQMISQKASQNAVHDEHFEGQMEL